MKKILTLLASLLLTFAISLAQTAPYLDLQATGYAEINNINKITSLSKGTISFWANVNNTVDQNMLFTASNKGTATTDNYEFYITKRSNGRIQLVATKNGVLYMDANTPVGSFSNSTWHNLTTVFDGIGAPEVYIDGVAQTLTAGTCCGGTTAEVFFSGISNINNIKIGALERKISTFFYSNGTQFDLFSIWDIAFTATEVASAISDPTTYKNCNRVIYYDFDALKNLSVGNSGTNDIDDKTLNNSNSDLINGSIVQPISIIDNDVQISNNAYVDIFNFNDITSLDKGTISFSFKIDDLTKSNMLFSASNSGTYQVNNSEFYINYRNNKYIQVTGVKDGTVTLDAYTPQNVITDNNWHTIAVVADNLGAIEIYIDGIAQTLTAGTCCGGNTSDFFFSDLTGLDNVRIGMLKRNGTNTYSGSFSVDDFRIYNTALTAQQIVSINKSESYPQECGLVTYYNFNEQIDLDLGTDGTNDFQNIVDNDIDADFVTTTATSLSEASVSKEFKLINNLTKDNLIIQSQSIHSSSVKFIISDQNGRVIMNKTMSSKENFQLDVSMLPNGFYVLNIDTGNESPSYKFVKISE